MGVILIILLLMPALCIAQSVKVKAIDFEPIGINRNKVLLTLSNQSSKSKFIRIDLRACGDNLNFQTQYYDSISTHSEKRSSCAFLFFEPVTEQATVRITIDESDTAKAFSKEGRVFQKTFIANTLEKRDPKQISRKPVSMEIQKELIATLERMKKHLDSSDYQAIWDGFTPLYQKLRFGRLGSMEYHISQDVPIMYWTKKQFIDIIPDTCYLMDTVFILQGKSNSDSVQIDFVKNDGEYLIDWIDGFTTYAKKWKNWPDILKSEMIHQQSKFYNFYFHKGSFAEKELPKIIRTRDKAIIKLSSLIDVEVPEKINIFFFDNQQDKYLATGHKGMGLATNHEIVEIYNKKEKLDPYHEVVHILMKQLGSPPAILNEGFAVYMSEELGAKALEFLGGRHLSINRRVREIADHEDFFPIESLFGFNNIGADYTKPKISYAEAASFVKFLVEKYGFDKFILAYKSTKNSSNSEVVNDNIKIIESIYNKRLDELEKEWHKRIGIL